MENNRFFNPSPLYKEFMLLDVIEKHDSITQRTMSSFIKGSVSMVNEYLNKYEKEGYIHRIYYSAKVVSYQLTSIGKERLKLLNVWYLSTSQKIYLDARSNIKQFFDRYLTDTKLNLVIYGAGEFSQIIIDMIEISYPQKINIQCIIDDNSEKHGQSLKSYRIHPITELKTIQFDYIFIASYNHRSQILERLENEKINKSQIVDYFTGIQDDK